MKTIKIAIMGLGTVGGGAYEILAKNSQHIAVTQGYTIEVKKILDKSKDIVVKRTGRQDLAAASIDEIIEDAEIDIVVETMGGIEPAKTYIKNLLLKGKSVVSANKELICKHWDELMDAASKGKGGLYFEASCVGGVPIIRTLTQSMQGDNIYELIGIINGTTNYILTKMYEEGASFGEVLKKAQEIGFAEADPTADIEGFDAVYKLKILLSLAFHSSIPFESIYKEGISNINVADITTAKELGYTLKLLAIGRRDGEQIEARVHPVFVPLSHPLAAVRNEFNAVFLKGDFVDDIMLYGRGAGAYPTGSAIVSDIISCINSKSSGGNSLYASSKSLSVKEDFYSKYYVALSVADKSGVLSKVTKIPGEMNISIDTVAQRRADGQTAHIIFLTHLTSERAIQQALKKIAELDVVESVDSLIRVL